MFWKNLAKKILYGVIEVVVNVVQELLKKKKKEEEKKEP